MALNREEPRPRLHTDEGTAVAAEVLRRAARPPAPASKGEESMPMFWRIFGTTVLSIAALVAVTLYQQLSGGVSDIRNQCHTLSEACGDLVKKDEFNTRSLAVANSIKEVEANNAAALDLWKERAQALEQQRRADQDKYEQQAKTLNETLQRLRERLAVVESRQMGMVSPPVPVTPRP